MPATLIVTSPADSGPGTLRAALAQATVVGIPDQIRFQPGLSEIDLTSGPLVVDRTLQIFGPSTEITIARSQAPGTPQFSVFSLVANTSLPSPPTVCLENLTITGGDSPDVGGGILDQVDPLTLNQCTVTGNNAGLDGGGIFSIGPAQLTINASTISNNTSGNAGAGITANFLTMTSSTVSGNTTIGVGAGLSISGQSSITNCTFSGNTSMANGTAINAQGNGLVTVTNCTVSGNSSPLSVVAGPVLLLINTIVAGNSGADLRFVSEGTNNLIDDTSGGLDPATNLLNTNGKLGQLTDNGGPTQTIALLPGSPAIGAGTSVSGVTFDQRFATRPTTGGIDIGAYQTNGILPSLVVNTTADPALQTAGVHSLREAITDAEELGQGETITFDLTVFNTPQTITLDPNQGTLSITNDMSIIGPAGGVTIGRSTAPGTPKFGIFFVPNLASVATLGRVAAADFERLTITGGSSGHGGAFYSQAGSVSFVDCTVTGNTSLFGGGVECPIIQLSNTTVNANTGRVAGGVLASFSASLVNSTIAGNTGITAGGILIGQGTITNSTISGNITQDTQGNVVQNGGGIHWGMAGPLTLNNTIVAGNQGGDINGTAGGQGNLIGDGTGGLDPATNLLNVDPKLSPLQNAGGITPTMLLLPGSPAINHGANALAVDIHGNPLTSDQRGFTRILGGQVDIGAVEVDTVAPVVKSVATSTASGTYGPGATVAITVSFDKPVFVTGTPQLALNSGGTALYASGSGAGTLTFTYKVAIGENTAHLDYTSTTALSDGVGGSVQDLYANNASLTLPAPGASGSLGASSKIVVDTVAPTIVAYRVLFGSRFYNLIGSTRFDLPWKITGIQAVFSKPITTGSAASLTGISATTVTGLGTNTLTWTFPAQTSGVFSTTLLGKGSAALADAAGNTLAAGAGFSDTFRVLYGDFNGDGVVSSADMLGVFISTGKPYNIFADLNGDGTVNLADVQIARSQIGKHL